MHSRFISWGRTALLAGVALALVLVVPVTWFPFQLGKVGVFSICATLAALLMWMGGGLRELVRAHGFYWVLAVGLLPLAHLFSLQFSTDRSVGMMGYGAEAGTTVFAFILFGAFVLGFAYFRTLRTVRLLLTVLSVSLIVAIVFQWIAIVFGTSVIPFATFADRSVNLIGKWNDLGLLAALFATLLLIRVELMDTTMVRRAVSYVIGILLMVLMGVINFPLGWALLLFFSVAVGLIAFTMRRAHVSREEGGEEETPRLPWLSGAAVLVAAAFLFFGATFNAGLTSLFPVSSFEIRPSYESTLEINSAARDGSASRFFVGSGPNTFGEQWLLHKPAEVNQTLFWNVDFTVGFSTLATMFGTVGLLGLLAWLLPAFLPLLGALRVTRHTILGRADRGAALALIAASLLLFAAVIFYVPSQNILLLSFVIWGATFGFLWRQGRTNRTEDGNLEEVSIWPSYVFGVVLVAALLLPTVGIARRFVSEMFVGRAAAALQQQDVDGALTLASRAVSVDGSGNALRMLANAGGAKLAQIAGDSSLPPETARSSFEGTLGRTVLAGQEAALKNPGDYRPYFILGGVYEFLATLNVEGAYEAARNAYAETTLRNPTNPSVPLSLARLEVRKNNPEGARAQLQNALTLKSNYTDAILLLVQLEVSRGDMPSAIQAATAAVQAAPGVAPVWFQLGLLYYAAGDSINAALALEQATVLVPDYANAKYFLGLSYYVQGRLEEGIRQFEELSRTNPDNAEVKLILANMTAGKDPFAGAEPPITPEPEERDSAPIEE